MSSQLQLDAQTAAYLHELAVQREDELLARLRAQTAELPQARMQIGAGQGRFMELLVRLTGAKRAIEIGVFTGYSSICIARGLGPEGRLTALDKSEEWTKIAREYWSAAGLSERIELRLGDALEGLERLIGEGQTGAYDFAFIDADKGNYDNYYEKCLDLLRPGGLIAVDNALWSGRVADAQSDDADTRAIDALNRKAAADERVEVSLLPVGDGVLLARKR